jgi:hypothetical protein
VKKRWLADADNVQDLIRIAELVPLPPTLGSEEDLFEETVHLMWLTAACSSDLNGEIWVSVKFRVT